jgi:sugar phosphate isomerase/epimerase
MMLRRAFLQNACGAAFAAPPIAAPSSPSPVPGKRIRLGMDTYSVRAFRWKALQLLDFAAQLKLDAIQISSLAEYESLEPAHLQKVKDRADRLGIKIDAGIGCICPTTSGWDKREGDPVQYILRGLSVAKAVGATAMRCFMGLTADRYQSSTPIERHMEETIKVFRAARSQALDFGIKPALENHNGDLEAREVRTIIEESGKDFVGSCLDAGNPLWVLEDPLFTLETLAPYVVTSHCRDSCVFEHPRGAAFQWVALGDGSIDLRQYVARFRQLCPQASIQLEIITGRPSQVLPYFEPDFWKVFPKKRAADFAPFVALAKRGHPFMGTMAIASNGNQSAELAGVLREQQRVDLERSVAYARDVLQIGNA